MRKRNLDLQDAEGGGGGMPSSSPLSPPAVGVGARHSPHSPARRGGSGSGNGRSPQVLQQPLASSSQSWKASLHRAASSVGSFLDALTGNDNDSEDSDNDEDHPNMKSLLYLTAMFLFLATMSGYTTYQNSVLRSQLDQTVHSHRFLQQNVNDEHKKQLQGLRSMNARLDHWLEAAEIRLGQVTTDYELKRDEVIQLKTKCQVTEMAEKLSSLQNRLEDVEEQRDDADFELETARKELAKMRKERLVMKNRIVELQGGKTLTGEDEGLVVADLGSGGGGDEAGLALDNNTPNKDNDMEDALKKTITKIINNKKSKKRSFHAFPDSNDVDDDDEVQEPLGFAMNLVGLSDEEDGGDDEHGHLHNDDSDDTVENENENGSKEQEDVVQQVKDGNENGDNGLDKDEDALANDVVAPEKEEMGNKLIHAQQDENVVGNDIVQGDVVAGAENAKVDVA